MRTLNEFERYVIEEKGTERPFSGEYYLHTAQGVYCCKKCDAPLYLSEHKFHAHCGWPAFDDEIPGAVARHMDADGRRVEIVCAACGGHLGHVFEGEYLTEKNLRHCVNSVSMVFKSRDETEQGNDTMGDKQQTANAFATFGAGCFWCVEAIFLALKGVVSVKPGYAGGTAADANYKRVCDGDTGHAEVVHIEYQPDLVSFETLLEVFFQSHDPTTLNRQGNDVGTQYRSVIFAHNEAQAESAAKAIDALTEAEAFEYPIVTEVVAFDAFYAAEDYHHDYFARNGEQRYCALVVKPKVDKFKKAFASLLKA
ncbi:bifunctional methionine sulfoxide reductase B/A protein [Shewanella litorisediminis]|uniref:Peptide methionine sulfoxide reductase MsrA n=1 Tax=Shewanella litorisediminis TaxID=1173586 RepID=A0ABX7FZ21_9GAMM|nr:bifunctional methionine sulfoxide reductase B/A protein [Shewanella litorisediminis]MCL2918751.1 bifunctional methionine sulfoxide reductase B/A protein [Shewanella litorisediminis]QRH00280.1 bifunctional methionine sulfoxide reductase B/A protein [Shewanella litorisediminis]